MLHVSTAGWAATIGAIAGLLALDLLISARRPHAIGFREAAAWSAFYIAVALIFGVLFGVVAGGVSALSTSPVTWSRRASRSTTCSCSW